MQSQKIFITGTGTDVGKTYVSAILTEALMADYWKPVQAGYESTTDSEWVRSMVSNPATVVHPELYKLKMPASPHIAAREEGIEISLDKINAAVPETLRSLVIEGAGGLMVPLSDGVFVSDLIRRLGLSVILVSRNYLGSINHSLLTARVCKELNIRVIGWIFNDEYLHYADEIARWTDIPALFHLPFHQNPDAKYIRLQAEKLRNEMQNWVW
jgi:dethiobiotin synthetase